MWLGIREDVRVVDVLGANVRHFANGQFTNNFRDLPVGDCLPTAFTDERGRVLGLAEVILLSEDRLRVVLDGQGREAFEEHFQIPLMLEDLEVEPVEGPVYTLQGGRADVLGGWVSDRSVDGGVSTLVHPASTCATEVDFEGLEALRIAAGRPRWPVDVSAKQLPHELGIRDTHLHFEKGCYRGQEIIHRVDVMGQVKKGLVGLRLSAPIESGADLVASGKKVGRMGSAAHHPDHGLIGLAVVRNTASEPGTTLAAGGIEAQVVGLPMA